MNKKGFLQMSFQWIFAIIVGAVILVLTIYGVTRFVNLEQGKQDIQKAQLSSLQTEYTKQMQTSTYTFALMANALKLTLPPSAHTMLVQATNEQKARVFQKAVIKSLFKK